MKRLFLLEDDLSLINGLSFALKKQGYEIVVARTTLEADTLWADGSRTLLICKIVNFCLRCGICSANPGFRTVFGKVEL